MINISSEREQHNENIPRQPLRRNNQTTHSIVSTNMMSPLQNMGGAMSIDEWQHPKDVQSQHQFNSIDESVKKITQNAMPNSKISK